MVTGLQEWEAHWFHLLDKHKQFKNNNDLESRVKPSKSSMLT